MANFEIYKVAKSAASLLGIQARKRLIFIVFSNISLVFMDLFAVLLIALLATSSVRELQGQPQSGIFQQIFSILPFEFPDFASKLGLLGSVALTFLLLKSFFSQLLLKKSYVILAEQSIKLSDQILKKILSIEYWELRQRKLQYLVHACTAGSNSLVLKFLGSVASAIVDFSLLIVISIGIFFYDFYLGVYLLISMGITSSLLILWLGRKAKNLGKAISLASSESSQKIHESLQILPEIRLRGRESLATRMALKVRRNLVHTQADASMIPHTNKVFMEISTNLVFFLLVAIQILLYDAVQAMVALTIALAATSRIVPGILRLQNSLYSINQSLGSATTTLDVLNIAVSPRTEEPRDEFPGAKSHEGIEILVRDIGYSYPDNPKWNLFVEELSLTQGKKLAIVGRSGSGKTTLANLLVGLLRPDSGEVKVCGLDPRDFIKLNPGTISYIPQETVMLDADIYTNVSLELDKIPLTEKAVLDSLEKVDLNEFTNRIFEDVGEKGMKLSGGQKQRLGIARAIFSNPKILVLDESTSALDFQTESIINGNLEEYRKNGILIVIAHRISTAKDADLVAYMDNGSLVALGNFDYVVKTVPDFAAQVALSSPKDI